MRWLRGAALGMAVALAGPAAAEIVLFGGPSFLGMVAADDVSSVKSELLRGASPNAADSRGQTPLMIAAANGNGEMTGLLLRHGARVGDADALGNTALIRAVESGADEVVDQLMAAGANVNKANRQGVTPLMAAARAGRDDFVDRFLKSGAKVDQLDFAGRSALAWAQDGRNANVVRLLKAAGAR
ncbi:MAG TPA: ankyrin repeat domain-containing protein [Alphaproteobacteria bacterium]|nr:ankyrin repeat domain-containing protein [Alphaproteobacteria bacterium]